ncbi:MAG: monovalent cation:proton antiporter-2 (CPA2) family protein [Pseudomonadota bacterium]
MGDILLLGFLFLLGSVIAVPIATRLGLGSVLGYLLAGVALAPGLSALGVDVIAIQHVAEFGVVMMLFLVGLELEPRLLWQMRARLLGLGGLQVALTTLAVAGVAMALGQNWTTALAVGFILVTSSTAIVLQTLNEKGLMRSDGGQGAFSVLLFQDIAVIPMLAILPLLAVPDLAAHGVGVESHGEAHDSHASLSLVEGLAAWQQALVTVAAIATVILGGIWLTRPIFRFIGWARSRELFTAAALMLVVGIALLMTLVGLSPALGTFLAGVVLANSEYRHELESDLDPFKGLLLGLFFITVGAGIDFGLLAAEAITILALTLALMALKAGVLYMLARAFAIRGGDRWLFALSLAQAGEFGFVLISFALANSVLPEALADRLLLVTALSMLASPALFILYDRLIAPRFAEDQRAEPDTIDAEAPVIVAGHGRFGGIVNRMLRGAGFETVVLDYSSAQLEALRAFGIRAYFGDATRPDLLQAAGIERAALIVVAIDERERITELVRHVVHHHPHVHVLARAVDRNHVYELYAAGCRDIVRETFDSSVRAGRSAFEALGLHPFEAERQAQRFVAADREALAELAGLHVRDVPLHRNTAYVARAREVLAAQQESLRADDRRYTGSSDSAWSPPRRAEAEAEAADTPPLTPQPPE